MKNLSGFSLPCVPMLLAIILACLGCGGAERERIQLERTLERSAVVFVCLREKNQYIVKKIFKAEKSWGSEIRVGETVANIPPARIDSPEAGVLITREYEKIAVNGELAQGIISFDSRGTLFRANISLGITLREIDAYFDKHIKLTQKR